MNRTLKTLTGALLVAGAIAALWWYLRGVNIPVLEPHGTISQKEQRLMIFALSLSLVVVIPVFILLFSFAWRYRAGNTHAKYSPELDGSRIAETIWWLIPSVLITILSVVTWRSSHQLDPYRPLASSTKPLTIQVVSLDWKWLFLYPEQHVASVNYVALPVNTPVTFELTSDSVMNSFWIPQLGGQMYTMPGMITQLHLQASSAGDYNGSSANISGKGFAGMTFMAHATDGATFQSWVRSVQQAPNKLTAATYASLARPSQNNLPAYYSAVDSALYDTIIMKYMMPMAADSMRTGTATTTTGKQ